MTRAVFAYGTLQAPEIVGCVLGRPVTGRAAELAGYARFELVDRVYPAIVQRPGTSVAGLVYEGLQEHELIQLDAYEGSLYRREEVWVAAGAVSHRAFTYVLRSEHEHLLRGTAWHFERFCSNHLESYLASIRGTARAPMA